VDKDSLNVDGITAARRCQIVVNAEENESCQIPTEMNNHHNPSFSITFTCLIAPGIAKDALILDLTASSIVDTSADQAHGRWGK
jgi:hypothetical protein